VISACLLTNIFSSHAASASYSLPMMMMSSCFNRFLHLSALVILSLLMSTAATAQIAPLRLISAAREDLNILLPHSIQIYEAYAVLADSARIRLQYATIDLRDTNLKLRADGSNTRRETTAETYARARAVFAVNGGYFAATRSESLIISDGALVASGPTRYTRGAFALTNGKPEVVWPFAVDSTGSLFQFKDPADLKDGIKALRSAAASAWHPAQAIGGGPVLIKNGKIRDTSIEEGFGGSHLLRHPRTAIGYTNQHSLVVVVVDGRQEASAGVTLTELARVMSALGCYEAVNMDGGGSSTMVAANEVANIPVDVPNGNRNSLRKDGSAWIVTEEIPSVKRQVILIDTDNRQYAESGIWKSSNLVNHYGATPSRTALSGGSNTAVYHLSGLQDGNYQLAAWWPVNEKNTHDAQFVVHHDEKVDTVHVNQTVPSSSGKWNILGYYRLQAGDFIEVLGKGDGNIQTDGIRLVRTDEIAFQPRRGDLRIAVVSDLNAGLGSATYEWQVDSIMQRIPRLWKPDLVLCGGDMVAGMGVSDSATLRKMWSGFDEHIATPLRRKRVPFAFTIGNHDGLRALPGERRAITEYWKDPAHATGLSLLEESHFPDYYSFRAGNCYFVSWDASSPEITKENLAWLSGQFETTEAKNARFRFVFGHLPLFSVAQERDSKGDQLANADSLRRLLERYDVKVYISGHQHAYYPGKRGELQLLNCGAAGSGPRRWLSLDHDPLNTITIMDVFYDKDTIVYSTYDIKHQKPEGMPLFDQSILPAYMQGANGFLIRNDVEVTDKARGEFRRTSEPYHSFGSVSATIHDKQISLDGTFTLDKKSKKEKYTISLYNGRHTENGTLVASLPATRQSVSKGEIHASIALREGMAEILSAGGYYVLIHPVGHPELPPAEDLRAQLYPAANRAPATPCIISHLSRNVYGVRDSKGLYRFTWTASQDADGDLVSYTYQLASDSLFTHILISAPTGRVNHLKRTESELFSIVDHLNQTSTRTLYHRVVATDGLHVVPGKAERVRFVQSLQPSTDFTELDPPQFSFEGRIPNAEGQGSGALWDRDGKLWMAGYGGTLYVQDRDGRPVSFSGLHTITVNSRSYPLKPINGIGLDRDGNILVGSNRFLLKLNASTGEGIAAWEAPEGKRAITSPRANDKGEVYAMSLFAEDPNYVLKESSRTPGTFDLIRTLQLPQRVLARTFDMQDDGLRLFFPDPGRPVIQTYISTDGVTYKRGDDINTVAAGCNAIAVRGKKVFAAVRASGITPSTLHMRDEQEHTLWTTPLSELDGAEARGIAVSADNETIVICSWDKGGGFYRYRRIR
jgi:hypothetical protein